jgi:hypothetical protein
MGIITNFIKLKEKVQFETRILARRGGAVGARNYVCSVNQSFEEAGIACEQTGIAVETLSGMAFCTAGANFHQV